MPSDGRSDDDPPLTDNPRLWRKWAEEARTVAAGFKSAEAKRKMIALAETYEQLADRVEFGDRGRNGKSTANARSDSEKP